MNLLRLPCALAVVLFLGCGGAPPPPPQTQAPTASAAPPPAQPTREQRCLEAARACANSLAATLDERGLDCVADEVIALAGGRQAMAAVLARTKAKLADGGVAPVGAEVDPPTRVVAAGGKVFAIVPMRVTLKLRGAGVRVNSYMLGVSTDDGQTWKFVDGSHLTRVMVERLFPGFPADLQLPPVPPPERLP